jgi:pimeloyl-ACP methyl ester carboxylesterase
MITTRALLAPFAFLLVLGLIAGRAEEAVSAPAAPAKDPAPPGWLIDIGGYRLHMHSTGSGKPVVVLLYGGGAYSVDFALVQPRIARFTTVCTYDRAGDAWSDRGPSPRTLRQNAFELYRLLRKARLKGPFILVGHSSSPSIRPRSPP